MVAQRHYLARLGAVRASQARLGAFLTPTATAIAAAEGVDRAGVQLDLADDDFRFCAGVVHRLPLLLRDGGRRRETRGCGGEERTDVDNSENQS